MSRICYQVLATLPDDRTAREYIQWLQGGHVDAVVAGGAGSSMIVRLTDDLPPSHPGAPAAGSTRVLTQYVFDTRQSFDHYLTNVAPGLRADGLARFGPGRGVRFDRIVGDIV
jgi:hypothetical protein